MKFDVVGIDSPCIDLAVNIKTYPDANGAEQIRNTSWQGGGKVATGMVAVSRLGGKGAIIGSVGSDVYGKFCVEDFQAHGIDTSSLLERNGKSTNFDIVVSNEESMGRCILYYPGQAEPIRYEEIPEEYLKDTKYLFVAMLDDVVKKSIETARNAGVKIFIDADVYTEELEDVIPKIDIFIASEFVYDAMFHNKNYEENCRKIMERGPEIVIFTFGERGCVGLSKDGYFELPSYHVKVVDTVGAGDVYHGAFLAGLLKGWDAKKSAQFASAVSAIKCTRIGGRAGIPDSETTLKFMKTGMIDYTEIDQRVEHYKRGLEYV